MVVMGVVVEVVVVVVGCVILGAGTCSHVPSLHIHTSHLAPPKILGQEQEPSFCCGIPWTQMRVVPFFDGTGFPTSCDGVIGKRREKMIKISAALCLPIRVPIFVLFFSFL